MRSLTILKLIMKTMITVDGSKASNEVLWQSENGDVILKIINANHVHPYRTGEFVKFQETLFEIKDISWEMIDQNSVRRIVTVKIIGPV